ncbi:STM4015 family protein [Streptomyces sp. JJ38]|uniref:STM4015 family protein n=1 Tax=Streptomyces sp. JJ38 TaxID=2738128 RepID=UPI001C588931|nr:STM4015 family protein [Streptomyces sp. JJ38]MBW1596682.1 STM4015 family protein [Streptomyces sp. JJ38]
MTFNEHLTRFYGLPVYDIDEDRQEGVPLPEAGAAAWRVATSSWDGDDEECWAVAFARFLKAVDPAGVRALIVGCWGPSYDTDAGGPLDAIVAAADRLTSLEAVFVGDVVVEESEVSWINLCDMSPLLTAYPGLRELGVRGGDTLEFTAIRHEALASLTIETGGLPRGPLRAVLDSELPALERLDLWLGVSAYGGDVELADLQPLLSGGAFPELRHLGLRNSEIQDEIAAALAGAPVVAQLRTLDLSLGTLGDAGAAALLAGQPLTHLERLDLHHHFLSEAMEERVREALEPHGVEVDLSGRETPWGEPWAGDGMYTMVSE